MILLYYFVLFLFFILYCRDKLYKLDFDLNLEGELSWSADDTHIQSCKQEYSDESEVCECVCALCINVCELVHVMCVDVDHDTSPFLPSPYL